MSDNDIGIYYGGKILRNLLYLCSLFFITFQAIGSDQCGKTTAKTCPRTGSTLLDDTYPTAAFVISNGSFKKDSKNGAEVPSDFILKVLKSYNYDSKNSPKIIVPSRGSSFESIKADLKKKIAASNGKIPEEILDNVVHVESEDYTWQQDYFESFFDPTTGKPVLRNVSSYSGVNSSDGVESLVSKNTCNIKQGIPLAKSHESRVNSEMGGNIEGLPGGSCLVGANAGIDYINQFCGNEENVVQIDVGWLTVGHVDELIKVLPNTKNPDDECGFSVMVASPRKALELLGTPRFANNSFIDLTPNSAVSENTEQMLKYRAKGRAGNVLCSLLKDDILPKRGEDAKQSSDEAKVIQAYNKIINCIIPSAHAGEVITSGETCEKNLLSVTNYEFRDALQADEELRLYNELVQKKMDEAKLKIEKQITKNLPKCAGKVNFIDVPNLFSGVMKENEDGSKELPKEGNGDSLLPNPTNSVIANDTVIFSDPQNSLFKEYLEVQMKENGLKTDYIDTWEYAHLGDGNLHCSSHSIPYCKP
jgi:hypothetical protein